MDYRLLEAFAGLFRGTRYLHRRSNLGDWVAMHLIEDLYDVGKSSKLKQRIDSAEHVLNVQNVRQGVKARRGDGSFGECVPRTNTVTDQGFRVSRGKIATVEIGAEVKILAKAMIKQIDRVIGDLCKQVDQFRRGGGEPDLRGHRWCQLCPSLHVIRGGTGLQNRREEIHTPNPGGDGSSETPHRVSTAAVR